MFFHFNPICTVCPCSISFSICYLFLFPIVFILSVFSFYCFSMLLGIEQRASWPLTTFSVPCYTPSQLREINPSSSHKPVTLENWQTHLLKGKGTHFSYFRLLTISRLAKELKCYQVTEPFSAVSLKSPLDNKGCCYQYGNNPQSVDTTWSVCYTSQSELQ